MISKRLGGLCAAIGLAVGLGGCVDDYGYGGVSVGYGATGAYGDPYYDGYGYDGYGYGSGYGGYGYAPSYYGWYGDFFYPGTGIYVYDQYRRPYRWNDNQRRYWSGRQRYRGRDWNGQGSWNGFDRRPGYGGRPGDGRVPNAVPQYQGNGNGYTPGTRPWRQNGDGNTPGTRPWRGNGDTPGARPWRGNPAGQGYRRDGFRGGTPVPGTLTPRPDRPAFRGEGGFGQNRGAARTFTAPPAGRGPGGWSGGGRGNAGRSMSADATERPQ